MQKNEIPSELHSNDVKELTEGSMKETLKKFWIKPTQSEPYSPWQVCAELCIREVKRAIRHSLSKTRSPKRLWDYCTMYHCELRNITAHPIFKLQGQTPCEWLAGRTPDISEYIDISWYETIWYLDHDTDFPNDKRKLGKWLGIAHNVGQALCYYILPASGHPIICLTIQSLSPDELQTPEIQQAIRDLELSINDKIGSDNDIPQEFTESSDDEDVLLPYEPMKPEAAQNNIDSCSPETFDNLIVAEVLLPKGDTLVPAKVTSRKRDTEGNPIRTFHDNPILDTWVYNVEFPDGHIEAYSANVIAENIYPQADSDCNQFLLLAKITDHRMDNTAVSIDDKYVTHGNNRSLKPKVGIYKSHGMMVPHLGSHYVTYAYQIQSK